MHIALFCTVIIFMLFLTDIKHVSGYNSGVEFLMLSATVKLNSKFSDGDSSILNSVHDVPIRQCLLECRNRPGCKAVEYMVVRKYCRLRTSVAKTTKAPGFVTATGFEEQLPCGNVNCGGMETCEANTRCLVKECGQPAGKRKPQHGNLYNVGAKLGTNLGLLTCSLSGHWGRTPGTFQGLTCNDLRTLHPGVESDSYINSQGMTIYCDLETDGGDWLVFQRRQDGSVDFYRNWADYKTGFGDATGEFWFGLEKLRTILTMSNSEFELRIDLGDWEGRTAYAMYNEFTIGGEEDGYRLHVGTYSGNATDMLKTSYHGNSHAGQMFTTHDNDNDVNPRRNCAHTRYRGAWWYGNCAVANLNGVYNVSRGVIWYGWTGYDHSLKTTAMMVREHH